MATTANSVAAAEGEKLEWRTLYPNFADVAEEEGFSEVAKTFRNIAKVEAYQERRYLKLLQNVTQGKVFKTHQSSGNAETAVSFSKAAKYQINAQCAVT
jgi:rubrerythrin